MEENIIDVLLERFSDLAYSGTKRVYNEGRSGAPVLAVQFGNDTYIVKIEKAENIEKEKNFYKNQSNSPLFPLLAPIVAFSDTHEGYIAVAYNVAFNTLLNSTSLFDVLQKQSGINQGQVTEYIETLSNTLVEYHLKLTSNKTVPPLPPDKFLVDMLDWRAGTITNRLQTTLPDWPLTALSLYFDYKLIRNPLPYLQVDNWSWTQGYTITFPVHDIHGDLHTGNILFKLDPSGQVPPALIDFGQTRPNGTPLFDFAYLEFDIIQNVLRNAKSSEDWFTLLAYITDEILPTKDLPTEWNVTKTWRFIQPIRQAVKNFIGNQENEIMRENYEMAWWFAIVAVGLNFAHKGKEDQNRPPHERKAALLYAAHGLMHIEKSLKYLGEMPEERNPPSVFWNDTQDYKNLYLQKLRNEEEYYQIIPLEHLIPNVTIRDVFVWPEVFEGIQSGNASTQMLTPGSRVTRKPSTASVATFPSRQKFSAILAKDPLRLVLLGHVGTGKTSLLHYLLLQIAHKYSEFTGCFPTLAPLLPVFIDIDAYAKHDGSIIHLQSFLERYLENKYGQSYGSFLLEKAKSGEVLFLFDGLDHVLDAGVRTQVVEQISRFLRSSEFKKCHCIITSRINSYNKAPFPPNYTTYTLADFTNTQITACIQKWDNTSAAVLERIIQYDKNVYSLAKNPLLLTILIVQQIHAHNHSFSFQRSSYFKECVTFLIKLWPSKKEYVLPLPEAQFCSLLSNLSFWIYQYHIDQTFPLDKRKAEIHDYINQNIILRLPDDQIEQCMDFMYHQVGVLIRQSESDTTFLFTPLLEYLVAEALLQRNNMYDFIREHLDDPLWCKVIRLVVGITLSDSSEGNVDALIAVITPKNPPKGLLTPHDLFLAWCMIDNAGHSFPNKEKVLMDKITLYYLEGDSNWLRIASVYILRMWGDRTAANGIKDILFRLFTDAKTVIEDYKKSRKETWLSVRFIPNEEIIQLYQDRKDDIIQEKILQLRIIALLHLLNKDEINWINNARTITITALSHTSGEVQQAAIATLSILVEEPNDILLLLNKLSNNDWLVRSAAATALGMLANTHPDILTKLHEIVTDSHDWLFQAFAGSICHLDNASLRKKEAAIMALGYIHHQDPLPVVQKLMKVISDADEIKDSSFADTMSSIKRTSIVTIGQIARMQSATLLDQQDADKMWKLLVGAIVNQNSSVRQTAVMTLGDLNSEHWQQQQRAIINALYVALSDSYQPVREAASMTLTILESPLVPLDDFLPEAQ
jgi:HEAT repeat protein